MMTGAGRAAAAALVDRRGHVDTRRLQRGRAAEHESRDERPEQADERAGPRDGVPEKVLCEQVDLKRIRRPKEDVKRGQYEDAQAAGFRKAYNCRATDRGPM